MPKFAAVLLRNNCDYPKEVPFKYTKQILATEMEEKCNKAKWADRAQVFNTKTTMI